MTDNESEYDTEPDEVLPSMRVQIEEDGGDSNDLKKSSKSGGHKE